MYLDRHVERQYDVLPLTNEITQRAEDLLEAHPLRAADSIQLAAALVLHQRLQSVGLAGLTFVCADMRLLDVATHENLPGYNPT